MAKLLCGRTEMCSPCVGIESTDRNLVCQSVGYLIGLHKPERIGESAIRNLASICMEEHARIDQWVTAGMEDAAFNSFDELIVRN